jgi:type II secretory pathway component GspD/PulD (secretin)
MVLTALVFVPSVAGGSDEQGGPGGTAVTDEQPTVNDGNNDGKKEGLTPNASEGAQGEGGEPKLQFNFRYAPWDEVLEWFAKEAGLSVVLDNKPTGTFNYIDDASYTLSETLDVLNSVLMAKGYALVRRNKMLWVIDLEDELDAQLVRDLLMEVPLAELDKRGEYELSKCRFTLSLLSPEEAESQVKQLLSPVGSLVVMPKARQIVVTETGGTLRAIRDILKSLEASLAAAGKTLHTFRLRHATAEEVLVVARPLLGIAQDASAAEDGSIRISADALGGAVFATGTPEKVALVEQIVRQVDGDAVGETRAGAAVETPQFMAHDVASVDSNSVLRVLQTMFVGDPVVRLEVNPSTGGIIALARPSQHRAIRATIAEMQQSPERFEVIPLRTIDPASAVLLIEKMFSKSAQTPSPGAPIVDLNIQPRQLVVRGTQSQIDQIRALLRDMGEDFEGQSSVARQQGRVRVLAMDPSTAESTLERIERIWPTLRTNRIRVVNPSPSRLLEVAPQGREAPERRRLPRRPPAERPSEPAGDESPSGDGATTRQAVRDDHVVLVSQPPSQVPVEQDPESETADVNREATPSERADTAKPADAAAGQSQQPGQEKTSEVIVAPGPGGLTVASEDEEALDTFESLVRALSAQAGGDGPRFHVFYLKHIAAESARDLLTSILVGLQSGSITVPSATTGSGASRNDTRGGVIGNLLQRGGVTSATGALVTGSPAYIVADNRLNSLFVQGTSAQVDQIQQLLEVIDQESGPEEVLTFPKPKFIPVYYTSAENVAAVVREVYADRIFTNQSQRQPGQGDFFRGGFPGGGGPFGGGFFGGGGQRGNNNGGRGSDRTSRTDQPKMTLGVDTASNSLVVSAPGPLLKEVEAVVREIDRRAQSDPGQDVQVLTLKRTNPQVVQQSLSSLFGDLVRSEGTSTSGSTSGSQQGGRNGSRQPSGPQGPTPDDIQRAVERFNAFRGGGGDGGDGGGRGGGAQQQNGGGFRGGRGSGRAGNQGRGQ